MWGIQGWVTLNTKCAEDLNLKNVKPLGGHFRRGVF